MGLKIIIPIEYQRVRKINLKAMPPRGETNHYYYIEFQLNIVMYSPPWGRCPASAG